MVKSLFAEMHDCTVDVKNILMDSIQIFMLINFMMNFRPLKLIRKFAEIIATLVPLPVSSTSYGDKPLKKAENALLPGVKIS